MHKINGKNFESINYTLFQFNFGIDKNLVMNHHILAYK